MKAICIGLLILMRLEQSLSAQDPAVLEQEGTALYRDIAQKIGGPDAPSAERAAIYLERLRTLVLSDRVAFYFNVAAHSEPEGLVLSGEVERPEFKQLVRGVFKALGMAPKRDLVEVVPDLKRDPTPCGVVVVPHVLTYSYPNMTGIPMDEALFGEPVYILKELPEAYLIKTFSGYWGYAVKTAIQRKPQDEFLRFVNGEKVLIPHDITRPGSAEAVPSRGSHAPTNPTAAPPVPGFDEKGRPPFIPSGSRLVIEKWGMGRTCCLLNPAGGSFRLAKADCRKVDHHKAMGEVVAYARSFLKTPYNLGGKNRRTGIDCSGLIQLSYRAIGINLARDAKQQYLGGNLIPPYLPEALVAGDVLYFMNQAGQVDHTALYLGDRQVIHATGSQVQIQSLDPASPRYLRRFTHDFIGAKRFAW